MPLEGLTLEEEGTWEKVSSWEVVEKGKQIANIEMQLQNISGLKDTEIQKKLENTTLKSDALSFIEQAANNSFKDNLSQYNADTFDIDWEEWLDRIEFEKFSKALDQAVQKIINIG